MNMCLSSFSAALSPLRVSLIALVWGVSALLACTPSAVVPEDGGTESGLVDASVDAAPPGEPCDVPNAPRTVSCGRCGVRTDFCNVTTLTWDLGTCRLEGVCTPGDTETRIAWNCAVEERVCTNECAFGEYAQITPPPPVMECSYGNVEYVNSNGCEGNLGRYRYCTNQCVWSSISSCGGGCPGTRRTSPEDSEEVCIPNGSFEWGQMSSADPYGGLLQTKITSFYIDRYPVTFRRYQTCVDAGHCSPLQPRAYMGVAVTDTPEHPDAVVWTASYEQAVMFCAWDGNRVLPTGPRWEKAAKGPHPRHVWTPWNDSRCSVIPISDCIGFEPIERGRVYDSYDAFPGAGSWYGVELMLGGFVEWTSDWMPEPHSRRPDNVVDPVFPATGDVRQQRGMSRQFDGFIEVSLPQASIGMGAIRCSRTAQ